MQRNDVSHCRLRIVRRDSKLDGCSPTVRELDERFHFDYLDFFWLDVATDCRECSLAFAKQEIGVLNPASSSGHLWYPLISKRERNACVIKGPNFKKEVVAGWLRDKVELPDGSKANRGASDVEICVELKQP